MEYSSLLLQIEIFFLLIFSLYIVYFFFGKIGFAFARMYEMLPKARQKNEEAAVGVVEVVEDKNLHIKDYEENNKSVSTEDKLKISELLKKIRLNVSLGEYDIARNYIVEGLTIDKFNIEINLELAQIYEIEKDYYKAEYIYKDLLLVHDNNQVILKKLGYALAVQEKYELALEIYKKSFEIDSTDQETLNMMAHLCYHKNMYEEAIEYVKSFLKNTPRDIENLILLGASYRALGLLNDAIFTYTKVLEIQPYNDAVKEEIESLYSLVESNSVVHQ